MGWRFLPAAPLMESDLPVGVSFFTPVTHSLPIPAEDPQERSPACRKTVYRVKKVDCNHHPTKYYPQQGLYLKKDDGDDKMIIKRL